MRTTCCMFRTHKASLPCEYADDGSGSTPVRRPSRSRRVRTCRASFYRERAHAFKVMSTM